MPEPVPTAARVCGLRVGHLLLRGLDAILAGANYFSARGETLETVSCGNHRGTTFETVDFYLFFAAMLIVSQLGGSHANLIHMEIG